VVWDDVAARSAEAVHHRHIEAVAVSVVVQTAAGAECSVAAKVVAVEHAAAVVELAAWEHTRARQVRRQGYTRVVSAD